MAFKKPPPTSASHSSAHHPHPLDRDFIFVAEFSEQEGPKPLVRITEWAGSLVVLSFAFTLQS